MKTKNIGPFRTAALLLSLLATTPCLANDGSPDTSFGNGGAAYITPDDIEASHLKPNTALVLADGKILVAGERNRIIPNNPTEPNRRAMLARFNSDGIPDADFGNFPSMPGVLILDDLVPGTGAAIQTITAIQQLADGSIIAAGTTNVRAPAKGFVVKIDAAGALDASFGHDGVVLLPRVFLNALAIDSQGRIVVAGESVVTVISRSVVIRLDSNGLADSSFGNNGDGNVFIDWDGVSGQAGYLATIGLTANDGILVGGSYAAYGPGMGSDYAIARLTASGAFDTTFADTGWRVFHRTDIEPWTNNNGIVQLLPTADGGAVFAGHYYNDDTGTQVVLGRLLADGSTDVSFGAATSPGYLPVEVEPEAYDRYPSGLARQSDGKLIVSVRYVKFGKTHFMAFRSSADGVFDKDFANDGLMTADLAPNGDSSEATALVVDGADRPLLAGTSRRSTDSSRLDIALLRLRQTMVPADRIFASDFDN